MNKTALELIKTANDSILNAQTEFNNLGSSSLTNKDWSFGSVELTIDGTEPFIKEAKTICSMASKNRWEKSNPKIVLTKLATGYSLSFCVLDQCSQMLLKAFCYEKAQKIFEANGIHAKMVCVLDGNDHL